MKKKYLGVLFLVLQLVLVQIVAQFPNFVEVYYSKNVYLSLSLFLRTSIGWIPFSVGDVLYLLLIGLILSWFWKNRLSLFKKGQTHVWVMFRFSAILYFLFHFLWGLNYYRKPLHEKMKLPKEYTFQQLQRFTQQMVLKTNALQYKIMKDTTKAIVFPYSEKELFAMAPEGYALLSPHLLGFTYVHPSIKTSLFSAPLSYMGFGGYLNPFTNEAQINTLKPKYTSPVTICHEMAHQLGYASENECNFIGFMAAWHHKDVYFKYSASTFAVNYCLYSLETMKKGSSKVYKDQLNKGVLLNFEENRIFWQQHQTVINDFFTYFYDRFLKMNQQKDGMESYSKFMSLLLHYDLKYSLVTDAN